MKLLSALLLVNILIFTTYAEEMTYTEVYNTCYTNITKTIGGFENISNLVEFVKHIFLNFTYSNNYDSYTLHFYNYVFRSIHLKRTFGLGYLITPTLSDFCGRITPDKGILSYQDKKREKMKNPEYQNCANWFNSNGFVVDTTTLEEGNIFRAFFHVSINNRNGINEPITVDKGTPVTIKVKPAAGFIIGQNVVAYQMTGIEDFPKEKNLIRTNLIDNDNATESITGKSEKDYLMLYLKYIPTKLDIQSKYMDEISTPELFCKLRACEYVMSQSLPPCPNCRNADKYAYQIFLFVDIKDVKDGNTQNYIYYLAKGITFIGKQDNPNKFCGNIKFRIPEGNPDSCKDHMEANSIVMTSAQDNSMRMFIYLNEKSIIPLPNSKINYVYDYMKQLAQSITISSSTYPLYLPIIYNFCHRISREITNNYDKFNGFLSYLINKS